MREVVGPNDLAELAGAARISERRREHRNLHADYSEPSQRFLNAIGPDSYIRPHRHTADPKTECLVALQGRLGVSFFDDEGGIIETVVIAAGAAVLEGDNVLVQISPTTWHTVVALSDDAVLLEIKAGPFDPAQAKDFAPWAPSETAAEARAYLAGLRARFKPLNNNC